MKITMTKELPTITIYNSLNQNKEEMQTHDGNKVRMYACGPTVSIRLRTSRTCKVGSLI